MSKKDEKVNRLLESPLINMAQSFFDDYVQSNAKFRYLSGLKPTITRILTGKGCPWCKELTGSYVYPTDVPKDVYKRHDNCQCIVTYKTAKSVQDVHTKRKISNQKNVTLEKQKQQLEKQRIKNNPLAGIKKINEFVANPDAIMRIAKNGGRHAGTYTDAEGKPKNQLAKSIASHIQQVDLHSDKINNPEIYINDWSRKCDREKKGLLKKWAKDRIRNAEEAQIEIDVWKRKFK